MSVRIEIDKPYDQDDGYSGREHVFTCLDIIKGSIIFNVEKNSQETVSSINVKLEGVSKTRLLVPKENEPHDSRNKKAHIEIHKLLYLVKTVFPPEDVRKSQEAAGSSGETGFTLPAGTHTYPFQFRIPVNNSCKPLDSLFSKLSIKEGKVEYAEDAEHHTRNTLPPSLFSTPGASQGDGGRIYYYIKVTVNRPQFYRTNVRKEAPFWFLPIDPLREVSKGEIFARKEHLLHFPRLTPLPKKKGFWGRNKKPEIQAPQHPLEEPRFTIEARLPFPPVLVPKEPWGLRIIMVKLAPFKTPVVLRQIQLRLFETTSISAHEHRKEVTVTVPLHNTATNFKYGMPIPHTFGPTDSPPGVPLEADKAIWENWLLPENILPSFRTCNITRSYQLEVTLGVSLGENLHPAVDQITLLIPVEVYTGFTPSEELLAAANVRPTNPRLTNPNNQPSTPQQQRSHQNHRVNSLPAPSAPSAPLTSSSRPSSAIFPEKPLPTITPTSTYPLSSSASTDLNNTPNLQAPYPISYGTNDYDAPLIASAPTTISPVPSATQSSSQSQSQSQTQVQSYSPSSPSFYSHERKSSREGEIWQPVQPQQAMADAPPTYEDAVLREIDDVDIIVADGPRREYPVSAGYFEGDSKRMSRLFAP